MTISCPHHAHGPCLPCPDHDDDEQEEEDLVLPHVQLAGRVAVAGGEEEGAQGRGQPQDHEGQGQKDVEGVVGAKELPQVGPHGAARRHLEGRTRRQKQRIQ